jgi:hypothetical protein
MGQVFNPMFAIVSLVLFVGVLSTGTKSTTILAPVFERIAGSIGLPNPDETNTTMPL